MGEPKPGRPEALTPEQVEKAKQLREQGRTLRDIAAEMGASHMAVKRALESAPDVTKLMHTTSVSLQESAHVPEKPELRFYLRGLCRVFIAFFD